MHRWYRRVALAFTSALVVCGANGCKTGRPTPFPAAPLRTEAQSAGRQLAIYGGAGRSPARYAELVDSNGLVDELRFDDDGDGVWDEVVDRAQIAPGRHLVLILDSVPFEMVREAQRHGRFGLFHPPSRIISPFPSMTDMSLNEFLGASPSPAMESDYFDGAERHSGWRGYRANDNSPWFDRVDWRLSYRWHGWAYLYPQAAFRRELAAVERELDRAPDGALLAYTVGPSALGFSEGRAGHLFGLAAVDRFCQMLMRHYRGRLAITLMSDHGHHLAESRMAPLRDILERLGYHETSQPREPEDVFVAEFGLISCAALYTPSAARVAGDVVRAEGVELAMYRDGDAVVVLSRAGRARITRGDGGYRYSAEVGDPLALAPIIAQLAGRLDAAGTIDDAALFAATVEHRYPDPLDRCWRAFHGLMDFPPDVLLSLAPGWHWGSPFIDKHIHAQGIHGCLNRIGTTGFVMTTTQTLPEAVRMRDVAAELAKAGFSEPARLRAAAAGD